MFGVPTVWGSVAVAARLTRNGQGALVPVGYRSVLLVDGAPNVFGGRVAGGIPHGRTYGVPSVA